MTPPGSGNAGAVGRTLVSFGLWVVAALGALATAFFVAMLLTPGYGDGFVAAVAVSAALLTLAAGAALRRRGRDRRVRTRGAVADVRQGRLLEQVAPRRRRWVLIAVAAAVMLAGTVALAVEGGVGALVAAALVGVLLALSLLQLAPGASWLRVTTRGVLTRNLGHTRAHCWADIDGFRVYEVHTSYPSQRLVGWSVVEHARADRRAARLLRWPHGVDDGLPTEYETDADELAARLQRYRDGRTQPQPAQASTAQQPQPPEQPPSTRVVVRRS